MRRVILCAGLVLAASALLLGGTGCGGSDDNPVVIPPDPFEPPVADAAICNRDDGTVVIYYDVFNRAPGTQADVVLDRDNSGIDRPLGVAIKDNRIFVSCYNNNEVLIWTDFANLTNGQTPDIVLDSGGSQIDRPNRVCVEDGDLYVCCQGSDELLIFRDVATLTSGDAPDVVLSGPINEPKDCCVADDMLFVANYADDTVTIFHDVKNLVSGQGATATLDDFGSFMDDPVRVSYFYGWLYVANRDNFVSAFSNPALLTDGDAPDYVLGGPSEVDGARRVLATENRLIVPSRYKDVGVAMFNDRETLVSGAIPDVILEDPIDDVTCLDIAGGALLGYSDKDDFLFAYFRADRVRTGDSPDLILFDPRLERAPELDLELRAP